MFCKTYLVKMNFKKPYYYICCTFIYLFVFICLVRFISHSPSKGSGWEQIKNRKTDFLKNISDSVVELGFEHWILTPNQDTLIFFIGLNNLC